MQESRATEPTGRAEASKQSLARRLSPYAAFAVLAVAFVGYGVISGRRAVPGPDVRTLDDFLRWRPDTSRFRVLAAGDQQYVAADRPGGGILPAGPATYVFDRRGRLVDWTRDSGNDPRFRDSWTWQRLVRECDAAAAREWVRPGGDPRRPPDEAGD